MPGIYGQATVKRLDYYVIHYDAYTAAQENWKKK